MFVKSKDRIVESSKIRTPFPSIRRSTSIDKGVVIRSRVKDETTENQLLSQVPFPTKVLVNKSIAALPSITQSTNNNIYLCQQ